MTENITHYFNRITAHLAENHHAALGMNDNECQHTEYIGKIPGELYPLSLLETLDKNGAVKRQTLFLNMTESDKNRHENQIPLAHYNPDVSLEVQTSFGLQDTSTWNAKSRTMLLKKCAEKLGLD